MLPSYSPPPTLPFLIDICSLEHIWKMLWTANKRTKNKIKNVSHENETLSKVLQVKLLQNILPLVMFCWYAKELELHLQTNKKNPAPNKFHLTSAFSCCSIWVNHKGNHNGGGQEVLCIMLEWHYVLRALRTLRESAIDWVPAALCYVKHREKSHPSFSGFG